MAALPRKTSPIQALGEGQVDMYLDFPPNGSSDPESFNGDPFITGIVHSATGKYTVTIDAGFRPKAFIGMASFSVEDNANPGLCDLSAVTASITAGSATTILIWTRRAGVAVDIAANAASIVKCQLRFKTYPKTDTTGL